MKVVRMLHQRHDLHDQWIQSTTDPNGGYRPVDGEFKQVVSLQYLCRNCYSKKTIGSQPEVGGGLSREIKNKM